MPKYKIEVNFEKEIEATSREEALEIFNNEELDNITSDPGIFITANSTIKEVYVPEKCFHSGTIIYERLIQVEGCPQYEVRCSRCGKLGIIYLIEGDQDWTCRKPNKNNG